MREAYYQTTCFFIPLVAPCTPLLEKLEPSKIICFGTPFTEMDGNIIAVDYSESGKAVR